MPIILHFHLDFHLNGKHYKKTLISCIQKEAGIHAVSIIYQICIFVYFIINRCHCITAKYSRHYEKYSKYGDNDKGLISIRVEPANVISLNGFLIF